MGPLVTDRRDRGRRLRRLGLLGAVLCSCAVLELGAGVERASSAAAASATWLDVTIAPRVLPAQPGFRSSPSGPVLDTARFTSVAGFAVPGSTVARTVIVSTTVQVAVPLRMALSVRAWCDPRRSGSAPDGRSLRDVLVIGQNPVPGRTPEQTASRILSGRAVVILPAGAASWCTLQLSPRTESTTGSTLRVIGGRFSATPVTVLARAAQRPAVLVGSVGAGGWPSSAGRPVPVRSVAGVGPVPSAAAVRLDGEAELTTCALGYHLCGRGGAASSVVDVRLVLMDVTVDGRTCHTWRGSARRVVITTAVHHVKVVAPALTPAARCGTAVRGYLEVAHRSGNAVEVEPTLGVAGGAVLVQTHTWLALP